MVKGDALAGGNGVDQGKYEFAFDPVPSDKRKSGFSLFVVLAGYPIAVSNFVTGSAIGFRMEFWDALTAVAAADAFLIFVAVTVGIIAYETGWSTSFLSRSVFGKKGSVIFSCLLVMNSINWIGINGDTFATMVHANFPDFPIPQAVLAIAIILVWSISAMRGYKGLEIVSWIGVPTAMVLAVVCFILVGVQFGGYGAVLDFHPAPENAMPVQVAISTVVGSWVFGCLMTPDVSRFGKSKTAVTFAGIGAFTLGLFCLQVVGIIVAQVANNGDFSAATAAIGLGYLVLVCTLVCLCTTQDNNIYCAGLAAQNILDAVNAKGKITHKHIALVVTILAALFGACGALKWLLPIIQMLCVLVVPIPAMILAERLIVKNPKFEMNVNPVALACWVFGAVIGQVCLSTGFLVSAMVAYIVTFICYSLASKLWDSHKANW